MGNGRKRNRSQRISARRRNEVRKVPLTNSSKMATVDASDFPWVSRFQWFEGNDGHVYTMCFVETLEHVCLVRMAEMVWANAHGEDISIFVPVDTMGLECANEEMA